MNKDEIQRTVDAVWRIDGAKIVAGLTRMLGDIDMAEEAAQDAIVIALEQWPESGIPDNPGGWLMTTAKRRAIDRIRRSSVLDRKRQELGRERQLQRDAYEDAFESVLEDDLGDDLLRLIFMTCHPVLSKEAKVALTLRLLGGLTTEEIARAFLVQTATVAQRIVRAKRTLTAAQVPFAVPDGPSRTQRLSSVLEVIYLIFNEGYAATVGQDWIRPSLCEDALRLGRVLAILMPDESEVHGLVALMEIQASRLRARVDTEGNPILLMDQNRAQWDQLLIGRGLSALTRAESTADELGPYAIQAAIAACHARAHRAEDTDWTNIAALYDALIELSPSPVVELNRAVAVSMAYGPEAGLLLVDALLSEPSMQRYHLLPSVRADLLAKIGRTDEARIEFEKAATLTQNDQERALLLERARTVVELPS